ncbi:collagen-binding domain-containing protein [Psychromonas sp. SP041]|uniref:collagen-binding domain-containing protein n=1 Tax=Psychromonas sp. SP041 TaxID=1365007 RepID=UPI0003F9A2E9|nr:collagen-binding domain-containing protein [Psychromonas sp. SP041]
MKKTRIVVALLVGLYSQYSLAGPIETLSEYNLIVLNDLSSTSEVEGKTLIGGDLSGTSNYGIRLQQNDPTNGDALVIAGDLVSGSTVNANGQSVVIAGNNNGQVNASSVSSDASEYDFNLIKSEFVNFSGYLSELAVNSILTTSTNGQPGPASFEVGSDIDTDVAVFNITAEDFFSNSSIQQYDVDLNGQSPSAIVINVSGEVIDDSNFNGNGVGNIVTDAFRENIIWNFFEATDIDLIKQLNGSLLAPFADLSNATPIEGSVVVNNFDQGGEVHDALFAGTINYDAADDSQDSVVDVPAPSSMIIFASALIGLGLWRRKTVTVK